MDRSLNTDSLRAHALQLITSSIEFEPFVPGQKKGMQENLALLGSLEAVTRESIEQIRGEKLREAEAIVHAAAKEAALSEARAAAASVAAVRAQNTQGPAIPTAPRTNYQPESPDSRMSQRGVAQRPSARPSTFDSRNADYRPALKDPSLVEALLALRANGSAASQQAASARVSAAATQAAAARFSGITPKKIDASTSYAPVPRSSSVRGTTTRILRPTK